jgi:hypothetical protein
MMEIVPSLLPKGTHHRGNIVKSLLMTLRIQCVLNIYKHLILFEIGWRIFPSFKKGNFNPTNKNQENKK